MMSTMASTLPASNTRGLVTVAMRDAGGNLTGHSITLRSALGTDFLRLINDRRDLPPPPKLANERLEAMVRSPSLAFGTHRRLEWLGDLWVNQRIAKLILMIYEKGPMGRSDPLSVQFIFKALLSTHAILKSNSVFSMFAYKVGLHSSFTSKKSANVFEAYCYALSVDVNQAQITPWLANLFNPLIHYAHDRYWVWRCPYPPSIRPAIMQAPKDLVSGPGYREVSSGVIVIDDDDDDIQDVPSFTNSASSSFSQAPMPSDTSVELDEEEMEIDEVERELTEPASVYRRARILTVRPDGILMVAIETERDGLLNIVLEKSRATTVETYRYNAADNAGEASYDISWRRTGNESQVKHEDLSDDDGDDFVIEAFVSRYRRSMSIGVRIPMKGEERDNEGATLADPGDAGQLAYS